MAFSDPQTLTINAVATVMARIQSGPPNGVFATPDGNFVVKFSQNSTASRFRREVRITQRKIAVDPISATNKEVSASFIMTFDEPRVGFSDAELGYLSAALVAWFTNPNRDKVLGGES